VIGFGVIFRRPSKSGRCLLCGLALLLPPASSAFAGPRDPFAGIPNITFQYYDVSGRNPQAIRVSMNAERPIDPHDGMPDDAVTVWTYHWRYRDGPEGCEGKVDFSARVILPRLRGRVSTVVAARWQTYMARLRIHEAGHARIAYARMGDIKNAFRNASCTAADRMASAILDEVRRDNAEYDSKTDHGMRQGAVFP
jgi:predicted secreted Zn-dependent protease